MKTRHIFKIIWTERYQNVWLILELVIIFCILWFCTDYLFFMTKKYLEPKGFDIAHTYKVDIGIREDVLPQFSDKEKLSALHDDFLAMTDKIKNHKTIEDICFSYACYPYTGSYSGGGYLVDSIMESVQVKEVSPSFFNVFRINIEQGKVFEWGDNQVIISGKSDDTFAKHPVKEVKNITPGHKKEDMHKVSGVAGKSKRSEYQDYSAMVYIPIDKNKLKIPYLDVCIRVKANADKDFIKHFTEEMETQLDVGPYFLAAITSLEKEREEYLDWTGYSNNLKSIYSVSAFLLINIFLGILGTFWFRIQSRKAEIGLRIAIGASKANIKRMYLAETVIFLTFSSLIAAVICLNIGSGDILKEMGLPFIDRDNSSIGAMQPVINYALTYLFLLLIIIFAVWYPARKASDIEPAIALKDE